MNYIEVNTSDLIGPALDWAVALSEGAREERPSDGQVSFNGIHYLCGPKRFEHSRFYAPSTCWTFGGQLVEKYKICIDPWRSGCAWHASSKELKESGRGNTPLEAACRAIVTSKLGGIVQIPSELMT